MAVTSVKETEARRSRIEGGISTHTRTFKVRCDDDEDGTAVAITASGVPSYGDPHPQDSTATARSIDAAPIGDARDVFQVVVEYSNDGEFTAPQVNPLDRAPEIDYSSDEATEDYFLDASDDSRAVVNSSGEPFENSLTRERGGMVITVVRNEANHDAVAADAFSNTCNSDPVLLDGTTYAPGTLKLSPIRATKVTETFNGSEVVYYRRTFVLKARAEGWDDSALDVGLNELRSGQLVPITDAAGLPVRRPYPLESGAAKPEPTDPADVLSFRPYARVSFAPLNLPT